MATGLQHSVQRISQRLGLESATDGELLERFLMDREETAFARLVQRHGSMVLGTCRRVLGNATEADDAFQAVFVVLLRKAHSFTQRARLGNVLYGIAYFTALKARAMASKRKAKEAKAQPRETVEEPAELSQRLDVELAKLPEKYREPVVLCELEGMSRKEAATKLGIPEGTISSRLATAHRMLAKRLGVVSITSLLASPALAVPTQLSHAAIQAVLITAPAGVAQLAYEVTKMMLLNKLKLGAAVVTGVMMLLATGVVFTSHSTAADGKPMMKVPEPKKKVPSAAEKKLYGKWVSVKMTNDPEIVKHMVERPQWTWTFDEKGLHTVASLLRETRTGENSFEVNDTAKPKELTVIGKDGATRLQCIYEVDGDTHKIGMYNLPEKQRPISFDLKHQRPKGADDFTIIEFKREKKDEELIQGLWEAETAQVRGKQVPAGDVYKVLRMRFKGNTVTTITEDGEGSQAFTLDTTTSPKKLATHPVGKPKEKKDYAIYDLDGDMLKLCHNTDEGDAGPLPTSFRAGSQDKDELIVLKRVKDEPKKEEAKKPAEAAWKTDFRKAYGLSETQMVRRIAPPFPDCRADYIKDLYKGAEGNIPFTEWFAILGWRGDWTDADAGQFTMPIKPDVGLPLESLLARILKFPKTRMQSDLNSLQEKITGDFMVRFGDEPEKIAVELETILRDECKLPVKFSFKDVEEDVLVLSGKYKANPLNEAKPNLIEVFANFRGLDNVGGGGIGSLKELSDALERHVSKPILLGKIDGEPKKLEWHYQHRPMGFTEQQYNEDHDASMILKNIATQTGLTVTTEKKKLRMLVIEKKELGK